MGLAILEIRERFESTAKEILVPFIPEGKIKDALFSIPQRGDKKEITGIITKMYYNTNSIG